MTNLLSIISIALAFHGASLAILIILTKGANRLTLIYSSLLIVLSIIFVEYFISYSGLEKIIPHLIAVKIPLLMLVGPLYFLWIFYRLGGEAKISDALHAVPFLIIVLFLAPFYILSAEEKISISSSENGFLIRNFYLISTFLHLLFYITYTKHYRGLNQNHKLKEKNLLDQLHIGFSLLLLLFGGAIVYSMIGNSELGLSRFFFVFGLGIGINALAYFLLKSPNNFVIKRQINDQELNMLATRVRKYLESEKPYLSKGFSKAELSEALNSNENYISKAFNEVLKQSFTSYINELRIEEAKRLLLNNNEKIYAVALDSGFASKNSFNRVFKQHTMYTPAEYRNLHKE